MKTKQKRWIKVTLVALVFIAPLLIYQSWNTKKRHKEQAIVDRISIPEFGDLKEIKKRRQLRVLVSYSKTNFFFDGPAPKGFDYEVMSKFEAFLNKNAKSESDRINFTYILQPFSDLLSELKAGRGDIAISNITVTPLREKSVMFSDPYISKVNEIIVQNKSVPALTSLEDLSGKTLYLLAGSSHIQHIDSINKQFSAKNLSPINYFAAPSKFTSADIFELINAGVYHYTIADDFTAHAWESVMPNVAVRNDLKVNSGGKIAFATRKDSPQLLASLNKFNKEIRKGSLLGNIFLKRYYKNSKWISNPTETTQLSKLETYKTWFKEYAIKYNFDWLSIVAMAYQESNLDHSKVSNKGAMGLMQIKQSTASSENVDIDDISNVENNIEAGVKYLSFLHNRYFSSPKIAPEDQIDFTWAAYNAGPARINRLRKLAKSKGYNPNKWLANVERTAAWEIGSETVRYVANINKYYIAYKLSEDQWLKD